MTFTVQKASRKVRSVVRAGHVGANTFQLAGRGLKSGAYRLSAVAVDPAGNRSAPLGRAFSIVK